jgi:hypothetical protein
MKGKLLFRENRESQKAGNTQLRSTSQARSACRRQATSLILEVKRPAPFFLHPLIHCGTFFDVVNIQRGDPSDHIGYRM